MLSECAFSFRIGCPACRVIYMDLSAGCFRERGSTRTLSSPCELDPAVVEQALLLVFHFRLSMLIQYNFTLLLLVRAVVAQAQRRRLTEQSKSSFGCGNLSIGQDGRSQITHGQFYLFYMNWELINLCNDNQFNNRSHKLYIFEQQIMSHADSQIVNALKQWKSKDSNLHHHMCELLSNASTTELNGLAHFERVSDYFKRISMSEKESLTQQQIRQKVAQRVQYPHWLTEEQRITEAIKQAPSNTSQRIVQNFQKQSEQLFQPVGISFGAEQTHRINLALRMIAEKQNAINVRFWGKVLTTSFDYFVIQGVCKKNKQPIITDGMEKYREGANYYSFWVCQQIISEAWYELPLITPQQVKISRQIKHVFTGRLGEEVKSYPKFPGQERHLLKCQLVRVTHNCEIVPNGLYSKLEENPDEVDFSEEFKMPEFTDLGNLENWVHLNPYILGVGRADYYKDPKLTPEQNEEIIAKIAETDPKLDRLKGINEDKPIEKLGMETCWVAKQVGNLQVFSGKEEGTSNVYGAVVLKNPHWPGWLTVANNKSFGSIYVGYCYKLTQDCFYPLSPQDLQAEGKETDEFDEPNPSNPPDELEPDSDEENKKPEQ